MSFKSAVANTQVETRTDNGMKTFESTLSACVDLFFLIGSSRGKDITPIFEKAYQEDRVTALRILAWARDIRGGAGERNTYTNLLSYIERIHPNELEQLVSLTPFYGRWKDLTTLQSIDGKNLAFAMIKEALDNEETSALCAKWMPRKGEFASQLRKFLSLTPKQYRKMVVNRTNVVESQMCAKRWSQINYEHVPSVAAARYQKAFARHDAVRYAEYAEALTKGEAKINASAVYPYDVIKSLKQGGDPRVVAAQWDTLPNYVGDEMIIPVVDVSGSMECPVGGATNLTCMDVSVSLGLYLADKNRGIFKDVFLTFTSDSHIEILKGNIVEKYNQLVRADWGGSTNLHSAFDAILNVAQKNKLTDSDMPRYVMVLSDMEFNCCSHYDDSAYQMIVRKYEKAGYTCPKVIFWNLNARLGNMPVKYDTKGTALVSGFSPSVMKGILSAQGFDPQNIMFETINDERYAQIV